jgi:EAL domain-containing protein (putative c-di-GMP-specific phosphodiesterase class I)/GGDEF domain-containing protein
MNIARGAFLKTMNPAVMKESVSVPTIAREISFAFQPIIHLETGATHGVEALMRGQERLGFESIDDVFDTTYRLGALADLEALLLQRAVSEFLDAGLPDSTRLFFNLDPRTVGAMDHVLSIVSPVLNALGMDNKRLCLEINERVDLDPSGDTARRLSDIRAAGIRIALDDFGIGFSRLKVLHDQHADYVKFDRYFIDNVSKEPKKRVFLSNMLDMFHLLGVTTVAEGIETEVDLNTCRWLGFGLAQGYHIARPEIGFEHIQESYPTPEKSDHWARAESMAVRGLLGAGRPGPPPVLSTASVKQAIAAFEANPQTRVLPVADETGRPAGTIQARDLRGLDDLSYGPGEFKRLKSPGSLAEFVRPCPVVDAGASAETMLRAYATTEDSSGVLLVGNARFAGFLDPGSILRLLHKRNLADARDQNHLTKLPGNGYINDFMDRAVRERDIDWILIQFNFEKFKAFNDSFGFQQGDRAIVMFADRLKRWFPGDWVTLGHAGGDAFLVGLRAPDVASATTATYALRRTFAEDTSGFVEKRAGGDDPASAPPALTCRAAMLLLKGGRPAGNQETALQMLSKLDKRAKAEGGFAFDRIG